MIPPAGFKAQLYPLRHRVIYGFGLSAKDEDNNTAFATLVRNTKAVTSGVPGNIAVNPHNPNYVEDNGPAVCKNSILDKLSLSIKFNMTEWCDPSHLASGTAGPNFDDGVYVGDSIQALKFLWRPVFFSFGEKLSAADDDTGTTVEALLGLTSDATNEDVVPLTTNKLVAATASSKSQPVSTVNIAEVFGDYNMTTNTAMEDQPWDESLFQTALRRYTIKGALRSMVGQTRHVTLTPNKRYMNFHFQKWVPRAIRRVQAYSFFGIQVHLPIDSEIEAPFRHAGLIANKIHLGCKIICNYHEWNPDHYQDATGDPDA